MSEPLNSPPGAPPADGSDALPAGTRLAEFEIREVIGAGGFGIVYRAWDEALQRDVALKEYMPVSMAGRSAGERVTLRSRTHEEDFALGRQSFVNEARLLARFDQPALVKVFRFWEGNGTAYMAMPLYQGRTLRQLRKQMTPGTADDAWMRALVDPLLDALEVMHAAAVYHRDIAPDNILWCDDGRPVLLDFGAARLVLADRTQNVTAVLKPQFAPIEQYAETQSMRQGPWTDLYALAGTCWFMLTGRAPLPATARVMNDELEPLFKLLPPGCSPRLLQALDWAMAVRPQDRPQSVAQFRDALDGRIAIPQRPVHGVAAGHLAAAAADPAAFDKTVQATMKFEPTRKAPRREDPAEAPATRPPESVFDTPERSVMLPPKSALPLRAVLRVLVVAGAAAGAWTTRAQWIPMLPASVQAFVAAPQEAASAPEATASAPEAPAASEAASSEAASSPAADAAAAPASQAASAPASGFVTMAPRNANDEAASAAAAAAATDALPAAKAPSHAKTAARRPARAPSIALPPPVLPPPNLPPPTLPPADESQVVAPTHTAARAAPEAAGPGPAVATTTPPAFHAMGPREACKGQDSSRLVACVRQLCDNEPRYRNYPICQRVHRQEEGQARETTE
jgi:serine/threonine protein kinase